MTGAVRRDRKPAAARAEERSSRAPGRQKAPPTRRYDPEDTRTRILESAYQLFATHGYSMTGTADIAAQAGVSEGSIFYHFGSKHSLLVELGRLHGQKLVAAMQAGDRTDTLTLAVSLGRCFDFFEANHGRRQGDGDCAASPRPPGPEVEPFFEAAKEIVVDWTKTHLDARRAGRPALADTTLTAQLVFAVVGEAMRQSYAPGRTAADRQRIRAECVRFCSAAIGES